MLDARRIFDEPAAGVGSPPEEAPKKKRTGGRAGTDGELGASRPALRDQRLASLRSRRVGLGILGMADCLAALNLVYGSEPSLSLLDRLMGGLKETADGESIRLAEEKGPFPAFDPVRHLGSPYVRRLPESLPNGVRA